MLQKAVELSKEYDRLKFIVSAVETYGKETREKALVKLCAVCDKLGIPQPPKYNSGEFYAWINED